MLRRLFTAAAREISTNSWAMLGASSVILLLFAPTLVVLVMEVRYQSFDLFPGGSIVLPWAILFCVLALLAALALLCYSIRCIAYPGTFLYRLTHLAPRRR